MKDLIVFYLLTSATQVVPLVLITLTLSYGIPFPTISYMLGHRARANRGIRNVGIARFEQFIELLNSGVMTYLTRFYLLACGVQFTTITLTILAIIYDLPLPFKPNLNNRLPAGTMYDLLMFTITTAFLQLLPVVLFVLAMLYGIPVPFMPRAPENRAPPSNEITRWEFLSQDYASIRLVRFENLEKTIIYAQCRNDRLGTIFKVVLCQGKERGSRTECFMYTDADPTLQPVIPAPIGVYELDNIFNLED